MKKPLLIFICIIIAVMLAACDINISLNPSGTGSPESSSATPATTPAGNTTASPDTSTGTDDTTASPGTSKAPETTKTPETTKEPETTAAPLDEVTECGITVRGPSVTVMSIGVFSLQKGGEYYITGTATEGMEVAINVYAPAADEVVLHINDLKIPNTGLCAFQMISAAAVTLDFSGDSLIQNKGMTGNDDFGTDFDSTYAAVMSKVPLTITGNGKLEIGATRAPAVYVRSLLTVRDADLLNVSSSKESIKASGVSIKDSSLEIYADSEGIASLSSGTLPAGAAGAPGFVSIDGSEIRMEAVTTGILAEGGITVVDSGISINMSDLYEDGTGVFAYGTARFNCEVLIINSPRYGVYAASKDGVPGRIVIESGEYPLTCGQSCLCADSSIEVSGGKLMFYESRFAFAAETLALSGSEYEISAIYDVARVESSFTMKDCKMKATVTGDVTPTKKNSFTMENSVVLLETKNPVAAFGLPSACKYISGTFIFLGEYYDTPDGTTDMPVAYFKNLVLPGKVDYTLGSTKGTATFSPWSDHTAGWICSDILAVGEPCYITPFHGTDYRWLQDSVSKDISPKG